MEFALILAGQVLVMFLLILTGIILYQKKLIRDDGAKQLTDVLLYVVAPFLILKTYQMDYDPAIAKNMLSGFVLSGASICIGILVSEIVRVGGKKGQIATERFTIIFTNCGFMGIPLVSAVFGDTGVVYCTTYLTMFNLIVWTYGLVLMKNGGRGQAGQAADHVGVKEADYAVRNAGMEKAGHTVRDANMGKTGDTTYDGSRLGAGQTADDGKVEEKGNPSGSGTGDGSVSASMPEKSVLQRLTERLKPFCTTTMACIILGIGMFFLRIHLPKPVEEAVAYIGSMNTPLAMVVSGIYIARSGILSALKKPRLYLVMLLKCAAVPLVMLFVLKFLPLDDTLRMSILIASACPTAANSMLFAGRFGGDERLASHMFALTTLVSIVSMPAVIYLASFVL